MLESLGAAEVEWSLWFEFQGPSAPTDLVAGNIFDVWDHTLNSGQATVGPLRHDKILSQGFPGIGAVHEGSCRCVVGSFVMLWRV